MLATLPTDQRRVEELRLAGLRGQEVAAALGKSHGAVKMLQFRAAGRLREMLRGQRGLEPREETADARA